MWKPQTVPRDLLSSVFTRPPCLPSYSDLWPQLLQQDKEEERWPPPSQTFFSPPGNSASSQQGCVGRGINSLAGGGDRDYHSQTLETSLPRQAKQPSCPHLPCWLLSVSISVPRGSLSPTIPTPSGMPLAASWFEPS